MRRTWPPAPLSRSPKWSSLRLWQLSGQTLSVGQRLIVWILQLRTYSQGDKVELILLMLTPLFSSGIRSRLIDFGLQDSFLDLRVALSRWEEFMRGYWRMNEGEQVVKRKLRKCVCGKDVCPFFLVKPYTLILINSGKFLLKITIIKVHKQNK